MYNIWLVHSILIVISWIYCFIQALSLNTISISTRVSNFVHCITIVALGPNAGAYAGIFKVGFVRYWAAGSSLGLWGGHAHGPLG